MIRTTKVLSAWNERRLKATAEFRYERDRRKFNAFLLDLVHVQEHPSSRYKGWDGKPEMGRRNCLGLKCVEVSTVLLCQRFTSNMVQKVKVLCRKYNLVRFDGSWIAGPLAKKLGCGKECQLWHVTALDLDHKHGRLVKVEWDDEDGAIGAACNAVLSAEGLKYGDDCVFTGAKELVDAFRAGDIPWKRFMKLVQACVSLRKGVRVKSGCRVFDALTMLPKEFRDHFRNENTGTPLAEICDQPAGQVTDGRVFVALVAKEWEKELKLGKLSDGCDDVVLAKFWKIMKGEDKYFYAEFCKNCIKQGIQGLENDHLNKYKKSKALYMYMANPDAEDTMYSACAWVNRFDKSVKVRGYKADSWKAWRAMCDTDRTLSKFILACKLTGFKDAWYRAYTFIEMCVDEAVDEFLLQNGFKTYRLHDARYSCDPKLVAYRNKAGKKWGQGLQAKAVLKKMGMTDFTKEQMQKMSQFATNTHSTECIEKLIKGHEKEKEWAMEPFENLTEERKALIRTAMRKMKSWSYYGEDELEVVAKEQGFDPWGERNPNGRDDDYKYECLKKWQFIKTKRVA